MQTASESTAANSEYRSLPGEYFALAVVVHATFAAIVWGWFCPSWVARGGIIVSTIWAVFRALGFAPGSLIATSVTAVVVGVCGAVATLEPANTPVWLTHGPFSAFVMLGILLLVLISDVMNLVELRGREFVALIQTHGLRILAWGLGIGIALYALAIPLVQEVILILNPPANSKLALSRMTMTENMLFRFVESFTGFWFLVLGAVVGSYLNVVVYRVPKGISVIARGSNCPGCGSTISSRENLPVIGWLRLNGRCSSCDIQISARYPTVEAIVGLVFLLLYFVELISGGESLPFRSPNYYNGVLWILFYTKWDLVGLYVFHCMLLSTIFAWAMIYRDGNKLPIRTASIMLGLTAMAPLMIHLLYPLPFHGDQARRPTTLPDAAITLALGVLAGGIVALLPRIVRLNVLKKIPQGLKNSLNALNDIPQLDLASWLLIGAALGWQAVVGILVILPVWMGLCSVLALTHRRENGEPGGNSSILHRLALTGRQLALPIVVLIHHCVWRQIHELVT